MIKHCERCGREIFEAQGTRRKFCKPCAKDVHRQRCNEAKRKYRKSLKAEGPTDGYIKLAATIVEKEVQSYRCALVAYKKSGDVKDLVQALKIEKWLLSDYYSALTLGADMKQAVLRIRRECGLSEEDMQ